MQHLLHALVDSDVVAAQQSRSAKRKANAIHLHPVLVELAQEDVQVVGARRGLHEQILVDVLVQHRGQRTARQQAHLPLVRPMKLLPVHIFGVHARKAAHQALQLSLIAVKEGKTQSVSAATGWAKGTPAPWRHWPPRAVWRRAESE